MGALFILIFIGLDEETNHSFEPQETRPAHGSICMINTLVLTKGFNSITVVLKLVPCRCKNLLVSLL